MRGNSDTKDPFYEYWFARFRGLGRKTKRRLLERYGEEELLEFRDDMWKQVLSAKEWEGFCRFRMPINIEETAREWEKMQEKGIHFLSFRSAAYPARLKGIADPPLYLFYRGKLPPPQKAIAIVGSRLPTVYGSEMARIFARELSKAGVLVISGLAAGIDVQAHRGALAGGGETYAVLGCGPDVIYPREHYNVYGEILERGGILSEYEPGEKPLAYRFPERNRLISGLADGVFIVEAKEKSGSLITADCGLEQGKEIYALPGRATDIHSRGANWLIRQGAKLVTEPAHILEDLYSIYEKIRKNAPERGKEAPDTYGDADSFLGGKNEEGGNILDKPLDNKEKIVYDCLSLEPKYIEEIRREAHLTVSEVISILFRMELNGYVKQIVKDYYIAAL